MNTVTKTTLIWTVDDLGIEKDQFGFYCIIPNVYRGQPYYEIVDRRQMHKVIKRSLSLSAAKAWCEADVNTD